MQLLDQLKAHNLPFATLLGIELVSFDASRLVGAMLVRPDLCTVGHVLHGGAFMAFADTLAALTTVANLPPGSGTTTIESKTNFLRPAPEGVRITGATVLIHRGRRTMILETRVTGQDDALLALVIQTQLVL